jgi:protocatechuate 3,4-dioxygenase beta subunit
MFVCGMSCAADQGEDVAGEYIRDNIVEKEPGLALALDLQVLDIDTCEPVADKFLEIWRESRLRL